MIYNLFLNSYTNAPLTNYYSAVSAVEYAQRVFAVDWSFLPQDKKYNVSFKFASRSASLTNDSQVYVSANFLPSSTTLTGGSIVQQNNNNILGLLKVRAATTLGTGDMQYFANPLDNKPVSILGRPNDNFLEITLRNITGVQATLTSIVWYMIISFEETH